MNLLNSSGKLLIVHVVPACDKNLYSVNFEKFNSWNMFVLPWLMFSCMIVCVTSSYGKLFIYCDVFP